MRIPSGAKKLISDVSLKDECELWLLKEQEKWYINRTYWLVKNGQVISVLQQGGKEENSALADLERFNWVKKHDCLGLVPRRNKNGVFEMVEI